MFEQRFGYGLVGLALTLCLVFVGHQAFGGPSAGGAPAGGGGTGDVAQVGDCTTGDCFTAAVPSSGIHYTATASKCARFDGSGELVASTGDCTAGGSAYEVTSISTNLTDYLGAWTGSGNGLGACPVTCNSAGDLNVVGNLNVSDKQSTTGNLFQIYDNDDTGVGALSCTSDCPVGHACLLDADPNNPADDWRMCVGTSDTGPWSSGAGGAFDNVSDPVDLYSPEKRVEINGPLTSVSPKFGIKGDADEVQFSVEAATGQLVNLIEHYDEFGNLIFFMNPDGSIRGTEGTAWFLGATGSVSAYAGLVGNDSQSVTLGLRIEATGICSDGDGICSSDGDCASSQTCLGDAASWLNVGTNNGTDSIIHNVGGTSAANSLFSVVEEAVAGSLVEKIYMGGLEGHGFSVAVPSIANTDGLLSAIDISDHIDLTGGTITGTLDLTGGTVGIPGSATLPATCETYDLYYDVDGDTDGSLYVCRDGATNDWKEVDDDGGAGGYVDLDVSADSGTDQKITDGETLEVEGGAGIATVMTSDKVTIATASEEVGFLATSGALVCSGGGTAGKMVVASSGALLRFCAGDDSQSYAAIGNSLGIATEAILAKSLDPDSLDAMSEIDAGIKRGPDATDTHILTTDVAAPGSLTCLEMDTDGSTVLASGPCGSGGGWTVNTTPTPDLVHTADPTHDWAVGGTTSAAPLYYDVDAGILTLRSIDGANPARLDVEADDFTGQTSIFGYSGWTYNSNYIGWKVPDDNSATRVTQLLDQPRYVPGQIIETRDECELIFRNGVDTEDLMCGKATSDLTLLNLDCVATGATTPSAQLVTVVECNSAGSSCSTTGGTVTLNATYTNYPDGTFDDSSIANGAWWGIETTSVTTGADYVHCTVEFTRDS